MTKGLTNLGNTCYMNAALQCLSHLYELNPNNEDFINDVKKRSKNNDKQLLHQWLNLQTEIWSDSDNKVVSTRGILSEFIRQCQKNNYYFESFSQNDTQEFINIFIDLLHNSIKRKVKIEITGEPKTNYDLMKIDSIKSWGKFFESNYSYIITQFYSKMVSVTTCPECNYHTTNHEPICTIPLTLKEEFNTIYDSLDEYVKEFQLDDENLWKCDKCKKDVRSEKKINFWELSPILIFCVKQFRNGKKINKHLDFPEIINMDPYCISKRNSMNYRLTGVAIHSGSLHGGHYYAMCRNGDQWYNCNDSSVREVYNTDVLKETPYCLFYVRI
jgi:ubiquitin carboxyl-terminal hydrolase 8